MPFLLAEILNFQGSTHRIGVGSFSYINFISYNLRCQYCDSVFLRFYADYISYALR